MGWGVEGWTQGVWWGRVVVNHDPIITWPSATKVWNVVIWCCMAIVWH